MAEWLVEFAVPGKPEPQGSIRQFDLPPKCPACHRGRRTILTSDNAALREWRITVGKVAQRAMKGKVPIRGAVELELVFFMEPPKTMPKDRIHPSVRPDRDKLERGVMDALSGIVYIDDAQVVDGSVRKRYPLPGDSAGVIVRARAIDPIQERMKL